jgi:8-oxo-dGTP pyrophosphatase MutT (NUDIX family)
MTVQLAGCVIKDKAGRILLIHRNTERLVQWELPGGKLEPEEELEDAAFREVKEEVGVQVKIKREIGVGNFDDNGTTWEYHWFEAEISEGTPVIGEPRRYDGVEYFEIFKLDPQDISINVVNLINAVKSGRVLL